MIFAELSAYDPPIMIGVVLGCLMFIVVGANAVMEFWRGIKDKPGQPPNEELQLSHNHLRDEFDKHVIADDAVHKDIFHRLGGSERGVEKRLTEKIDKSDHDAKQSRRDMHAQITELGQGVAALEAKAEMTNQRVVQMDSKLDRIIERQ